MAGQICPTCGLENTTGRNVCKRCRSNLNVTLVVPIVPGWTTLLPSQNSKYVCTSTFAPLFRPSNNINFPFSTLPGQPYEVIGVSNDQYEIVIGGGQTALLHKNQCQEIEVIGDNLLAIIPAVAAPAGRDYARQVLDPMPLNTIPLDSNDYRLMIQWIGNFAVYPPTVIGRVESCVQKGAESFSVSHSSTVGSIREESVGSTLNTHTTGVSATQSAVIHHYQLLIESNNGARRVVEINRRVNYVPQVGDFVVVWGPVHNNICSLEQGIQRDIHDLSNGIVLVARNSEQINKGGCSTPITIYSLLLLVGIGLKLFSRKHR